MARVAARLRAQADPQVGFTLGVFAPGLVGMVTILRADGAKSRHKANVFAMGVAESRRGAGLGRVLMAEAIVGARAMAGVEQLLLTVVLPNEPARRLYHGLGFVTYGIDKRGLKLGGRYWDEEQMVLDLGEGGDDGSGTGR